MSRLLALNTLVAPITGLLLSCSLSLWASLSIAMDDLPVQPVTNSELSEPNNDQFESPTLSELSTLESATEPSTTELAAIEPTVTEPLRVFNVIQSDMDKREYRYLQLPNKLRILLISDPATEKSAAALDVYVGHNQNPPEYPGLAHFLEHMLFLGTQKYPSAGEYQTFISQHSGRYNAYTAPEHTNYFFEIDNSQLAPALDRFAQFFIAPLLAPDYIERERKAVHSEYRAKIQDDTRRTLDVYRQLLNPNHPAANFSVGNLDTLVDHEDQTLQQALVDFYQTYYSAELMTLVVLGQEPLDQLQQLVSTSFSPIKEHPVSLPDAYPALFPDKFLPAAVTIQPAKELRQLAFLFPIPEDDLHYRKKPFEYIANLLGHEGNGSVLSLLKELGWAENLTAGVGLKSRHDGFFYITVNLTETGVKAKDQIPVLVLHMIRQLAERGLKEWRYRELQQMAEINFRFQEKIAPIEGVRGLAEDMHRFAPEDVLRGRFIYQAYDEKLLKQSLSYLRMENLLLTLVVPSTKPVVPMDADVSAAADEDVETASASSSAASSAESPNNSTSTAATETALISPYYQTPYTVKPIVDQNLEVKQAIRKRLFFPEENIFIPNRLGVKTKLLLPVPSENFVPKIASIPQLVVNNERTQAWYLQDQLFQTPKTHIYLRLKLPLVAKNVAGAAQAHLFTALVRDQLNEFSYPASLAGLDYSINANPRGLDIHIDGYSSRQGLLLNKIAESVRKGKFTEARFNILKAELIRTWRNQQKNSPYQVLLPQIPALQYEPYWNDVALSQALEQQTFAHFQLFAVRLLQDAQLDALFYGNIYRQEAIKLAALSEHRLLGPKIGRQVSAVKVFQLAEGEKPWWYTYPLEHSDKIVILYVQGIDDSVQDAAHMQLLRQVLQPIFFDRLRTEQQLGYVVSMIPLALRKLEGSVFVVQSPTESEAQLMQEIAFFLAQTRPQLMEDFIVNQQSLVRRLEEPARSMAEQAERWWESILLDDKLFNRRQSLADAVAAITPESLAAYYEATMLTANRRLWLSSRQIENDDVLQLLQDIPSYRKQQKSLTYP